MTLLCRSRRSNTAGEKMFRVQMSSESGIKSAIKEIQISHSALVYPSFKPRWHSYDDTCLGMGHLVNIREEIQ